MVSRYNSELANTLGNLVNRSVAMVNKYFDGEIFPCGELEEFDRELRKTAETAVKAYEGHMNAYKVADAISDIWELVRRSNKYIDETMPWSLAKSPDGKERLKTVLYHLVETIRILAILLSPIMPSTAKKIGEQIHAQDLSWDSAKAFGTTKAGSVGEASVLFARMDEEKKLEEIQYYKLRSMLLAIC